MFQDIPAVDTTQEQYAPGSTISTNQRLVNGVNEYITGPTDPRRKTTSISAATIGTSNTSITSIVQTENSKQGKRENNDAIPPVLVAITKDHRKAIKLCPFREGSCPYMEKCRFLTFGWIY